MGVLKFIENLFAFESGSQHFELLETEYGQPKHILNKTKEGKLKQTSKSETVKVSDKIQANSDYIKHRFRFDVNPDLIIREFMLAGEVKAVAFMINGLVSNELIGQFILRDGMKPQDFTLSNVEGSIADYAIKYIFSVPEAKLVNDMKELEFNIMEGQTVVFIDGDANAIVFDTREYPQRSVETPENEKTVLGPSNSFNENIRTNISLIRRMVNTEDLVCEMRKYGTDNSATIGIMYREGVANPTLVQEVKRRISQKRNPTVLTTGILEQFIENSKLSPLPQMLLTERPDRSASFLVEGHIVLLCDGSPMAAILPVTLFVLLSSPEDTYSRQPLGTVLRILRYAGAFISVFLPGIFIAIVMYHHGFLSSEVLNTLVASRKMVFVSLGAELIILLLVFQLVREAGLRVPGSTGQAIGIIGGVLLGQAAVSANLVSTVVLILIALTGLGNFCIADHSTQITAVYFRLGFILFGWMAGFLGIVCAFSILIAYLATLKSFGVPMLSPYSPKSYAKRQILFRGKIGNDDETDYMNEVNEA